jgi:O-antigen/teichoic acid export membrane protein
MLPAISLTTAMQAFQLMRVAAAILTGVVMAKSGLPTANIGAYEMLLYLGTTLTFFWVNGLLQGITPVYFNTSNGEKRPEGERKILIFNIFLVFFVLGGLVYVAMLLFQNSVVQILAHRDTLPFYQLFACYLWLNLPTYPVEYILLIQERPKAILIWGLAIFGLHLVAIGLPLALGWGLGASIWALVTLAGLKLLVSLWIVFQYGTLVFRHDLIVAYLRFSSPLVMNTLVSNAMLLWDAWLVAYLFQDAATFAIFRYGSREFPLAMALCTALGAAMVPVIARESSTGYAELKQQAKRLMRLLFPVAMVLLFLAPPLFPYVFNADFAQSAPIFNIYLLITASRVLLPGTVLLGHGDAKSTFYISLIELLARIALTWILGTYYGLVGIAWGVVISFWVEKIGQIRVLEVRHRIRTSEWLDVKVYLFWCVMLTLAFVLNLIFQNI